MLCAKEKEKPLKDGEIASLERELRTASTDLQVRYLSAVVSERTWRHFTREQFRLNTINPGIDRINSCSEVTIRHE